MKHLLKIISSLTIISTGVLAVSCTRRIDNNKVSNKDKNNNNESKKDKENKSMNKNDNSEIMPQDDPRYSESNEDPSASHPKVEIYVSEEEKQEVINALKKVFKEQEEAFGSFHTYGEVLDQIKVYLNDNKIKHLDHLRLTNKDDKNKKLVVDNNGNLNKVKISFFDKEAIFTPKKVLQDEVIDKYDSTKSQLIQIGYKYQELLKNVKIKQIHKKTKKVPFHLPLKITSLDNAFRGSEAIHIENLDKWKTTNVRYLTETFSEAINFDQDINDWDVSNVFDMTQMFAGAKKFNKSLNSWNTANTKTMYGMFWDAENFNGDISKWSVKKVEDMSSMFSGATNFNQDLSKWDTSNVESMEGMFSNTKSFNSDISGWNVSSVTSMKQMFQDSKGFRHSLSSWKPIKVTIANDFRKGSETNIPDQNLPKFSEKVLKTLKI
ncbi:BspA family leucine-rich repeat surface protein [Mycoplasma feriruminatoris]|uniref:BspA family leucine-rich repeat surface protein n=1 Tax=Mycoplasma feriruminatoris TaxID=1179777 RepID=A0AAQ3DPX6_9MOLU|nr:BspA family leucine-rich repeat surface protein [Mycoplasma feriruminatoris]WFQ94942.1 BspA family leucine-rich repeat surface protein [Mycoplasma feriruminatoris]